MPNTIKIKNSAVAAKVPVITDLDYGEIALNYADGKIFYKRVDNTVQSISSAGSSGPSALTIDNKIAIYTVVAGDLGKIINCTSGTFTVSLTAAATLGAGFNCWIWNTGTGNITIDPSGAETIQGLSTWILRTNELIKIVCTGTLFHVQERPYFYAEKATNSYVRPVATGDGAIAIGTSGSGPTTASGSIAFAVLGNAGSNYSVAIGLNSSGLNATTVTGAGAMALGGSYASGVDSFAAAIADNNSTYGATGANGIALGRRAKASSNSTFAVGNTALASGLDAIAIGTTTTASGNSSVSLGYNAEALGAGSLALGSYSQAVQIGKLAYSSAYAGAWNYGFQQYGLIVLIKQTADATASVLTSNTGAASTTNQVILPNNSAYAFSGTIVARRKASEGTQTAAWRVEGLIRREGTAASTVLVNSALTVLDNTSGWNIALSADTTNGGLAVTATGAAATNIRWVATLQTSEVTYA